MLNSKYLSFSNEPLTEEAFSKKYWLDGDAPYQYHRMNISDGKDEREQLIINNIRAIWDLFRNPLTLDILKKADAERRQPISPH